MPSKLEITYPIPKRFIRDVAEKSRRRHFAEDTVIDEALEWLREQIISERNRLDWYYEKIEAKCVGEDD